jgi:D-alanine-D-alanine ligase
MTVLVLYTLPPASVGPERTADEFTLDHVAVNLLTAFPDAVAEGVRGEAVEVMALLERHHPEVVFNVCEAPQGRPDLEAQLAGLLELIGVPFTGSPSDTLALCRRKDRTKAVLAAAGIGVPRSDGLPAIVKPMDDDGSAMLHAGSVCHTTAEIARETARLNGRALVEEFLPGREFVISLWGATTPDHHAIGETLYEGGLELITYAAKWETESADFINSPLSYTPDLSEALRDKILGAAKGAWLAVGARGYIRVDVRLDAAGEPRVLDVNPNPELGPGVGICRAAQEAGWTWERFVQQQIEWAGR